MSIDVTIEGPVATVLLNRPEKLNALTWDMRLALTENFTRLNADHDVRAVIVTGAGRGFCSGADVDRMHKTDLVGARDRIMQGAHPLIRALHGLEKPVIAAVRGPAVGLGWSIALACDLIVASETARFSQIYRRVGLAPDGGAAWFLARLVGMAKAKELAFSSGFVSAADALSLGLVNYVVPDGDLEVKTKAIASDLAAGPTFAFGMTKRLFNAAVSPSLEEFLALEAYIQPQLNQSADHHEGVASFREKRDPKFIGR